MDDLTEHARKNRAHWDAEADEYQAEHGRQLAQDKPAWGVWSIPEAGLRVLGDVRDKDILELGCGAAHWSIALTELGARCVGLDNSAKQLEYARRAMAETQVDFPLVHASAEAVPLPDASFDVIFCDHGAMTFADPDRTVPEAARLLRPGGLFAFSAHTPIHYICWNPEESAVGTQLRENYFEQKSDDDGDSVVFSRPYGEWIRLFRSNGFAIEDLVELRAPEHAETTYTEYVTHAWARQWPAEHIWRLRRI